MEIKTLLKELADCTTNVANDQLCNIVKKYTPSGWSMTTDAMHNIVIKNNKEGYQILLDAHLDEIGLVVTAINEHGFVKTGRAGGVDLRLLAAQEITIHGNEDVYGLFTCKVPHLSAGDDKVSNDINDYDIDTGYSKEQLEQKISLGDFVTLKNYFTELQGDKISSKSMDDRACMAIILLSINSLKDVDTSITVLFSSGEELGCRGAKTGAYANYADEAIILDVSFGDFESVPPHKCGKLGGGPMIGVGSMVDKEISDYLTEIAKNNNITYQIEALPGSTGTNLDVISTAQGGIKSGIISLPLRYMHSSIETLDIKDVETSAKLLQLYLQNGGISHD